eukprot:TRINITY_DN88307_c0_g1_i1.p1 TRINITY_DN88307_c0_g1~~TRINITY_DN88307_c0_g1_i1.p1  ORF type:complete len:534 (-),score=131.21 TRINITY_DN88307_c0_g1_i1:67-1668(-)
MPAVDEETLRLEVQKLLVGIDIKSTSIGKLRSDLEAQLGLPPGGLDSQKDRVQFILSSELSQISRPRTEAPDAKKPRLDVAEEKPTHEEKEKDKDKKEKDKKKNKKDKKEKKDQQPEPATQAVPQQPKAEETQPQEPKAEETQPAQPKPESDDEGLEAGDALMEPEPPVETVQPDVAVAAKEAEPTAPTMGMASFEDFQADFQIEPEAPQQHSRGGIATEAMALSGAEDGNLRLWNLESYSCVRVMEGHSGTVYALVVNWHSMEALSGADDSAKLWNIKQGGCQKTFADTPEGCTAVAADWTGRTAVSGCGDGSLKVWCMSSAKVKKKLAAHRGGVWALAADFARNRLASGGEEEIKIWNTGNWTPLYCTRGYAGGVNSLNVHWKDNKMLAGASNSQHRLQLWNFGGEIQESPDEKPADSRMVIGSQEGEPLIGHRDVVSEVIADWESGTAVTGGWDGQLIVWNLEKRAPLHAHECKSGRVRSLAVDFQYMQAICGASNGSMHVVDLSDGQIQRSLDGHEGAVTAVCAKRIGL